MRGALVHVTRLLTLLALLCATPALAQLDTTPEQPQQSAILQADQFDYDRQNDQFIASGHVELEQDGQLITADRMIYSRTQDSVIAEGNVVFVDKTGQVYFAEKVDLQQAMKKGAIEQIGVVFPDGSRFAARHGEQKDENTTILRDGIYSPCNLCKDDPHKAPQWQLRAGKIVHDKKSKDIYYHNVKFDAYGVPIGYMPYFSHPDPSVTARSGFLMPRFSTDTKKGIMLRNYYYYNISPYEDVTMELSPTQKAGTVLGAEYRRNYSNGKLFFSGSINESTIRGGSDDDQVIKPEKMRGHVFANGYFQLNPQWNTGFNIRRASDQYYLRDFDFEWNNVLVNNIYLERVKGRNYADISATYFQDLRPNITQEQPDILPWAKYSLMGNPNAMLGGRWSVDNQLVTLFRNGEQSVSRLSTTPEWERRDILPLGFQSTINTKLRADGYWVRQNSPFDANKFDPNLDRTVGRFIPSAQTTLAYPLIRPSNPITALIEPKVSLTMAPNSANNDDIPNEDSRDAQIDISNLFDDSRFPGYDRFENGSHLAYGLKMGGYHDNGNSAFLTLGQSYRLSSSNPFPNGSGLENDRSDYVGQLETTFYNKFYTDYRFQMNEDNFSDQRHELQAVYMGSDYEFRTNYIYANQVQGTGLNSNRQQIGFSGAQNVTDHWAVALDSINDLSGDGMLKAGGSLQYKNECLRLTWRLERDLTARLSGGSDTRFMFSVGLRNLGGYDTPLLFNDPLYRPFNSGQSRL